MRYIKKIDIKDLSLQSVYKDFIKKKKNEIQLIEDMKTKRFAKFPIFKKNKKQYLKIKEKDIPLVWDILKKYNSSISKHLNVNFLIYFNKFRKEYVDAILKAISEYTMCDPLRNCTISSYGSRNISSDYDITITGTSNVPSLTMYLFNKFFTDTWNNNSEKVFDTNIYGTDYIKRSKSNFSVLGLDNDDVIEYLYIKNKESPYFNRFINSQHAIASMKIVRSLFYVKKRLVPVNDLSKNVYNLLLKSHIMKDLLFKAKKRFLSLVYKNGKLLDLNNYNVMNDNYFNRLKKAETQRDKFVSHQYSDKECYKLCTMIEDSLLFAPDPYFSEGAIFHVVGKIQKLADFDITEEQYFDSAIENFGDFMRVINEGSALAKYISYIVYSSKYLYRVFDAITRSMRKKDDIDEGVQRLGRNVVDKTLKDIKDVLYVIKSEFRTKKYTKSIISKYITDTNGKRDEMIVLHLLNKCKVDISGNWKIDYKNYVFKMIEYLLTFVDS
jgi:hypothetical protein